MSLHYDLLIRNALIIDGAHRPRFAGDIGLLGEARPGRVLRAGAAAARRDSRA